MTILVKPRALFIGLSLLCLLAIWLSLALGPVSLPLLDTLHAVLRLVGLPIAPDGLEQAELIVGQIRLPRTLLGLAVGGVLALTGVAMQGLFRNPLADPGLVGVSSGAALGAAIAIVGGSMFGGLPESFGPYLLSVCAFLGGLGGDGAGVSTGPTQRPDERRDNAAGRYRIDRSGGLGGGVVHLSG